MARSVGASDQAVPWRRRVSGAAALVVCLLAVAWGLLCFRAAQHYQAGLEAERIRKSAEAARELESAVGCCAPFNPYCGAAAEKMLALSRRIAPSDPPLAAEIRDRLMRSLRGARWLLQPHSALLAAAQSSQPAPPPKDPHGGLFLLSCLALSVGLGSWWLPRPLPFRAALGAGGLASWAVLLYLC